MKILTTTILLTLLNLYASAQFDLNKLKEKVNQNIPSGTIPGTQTGTQTGTSNLSNDEIIKGLKEALVTGTNNSTSFASQLDGYFKNPNIKIPFPPNAKKMETTLRNIGMGAQVDKAILTMNRGAERAAKEAAPIFIDAIKAMTISDGMGILKGGDNAATNYLKGKTTNDLTIKFRPIIEKALQEVQMTKYWTPLVTKYNKIPMVEKMNPDLNAYVTNKAIEGLFFLVAQEETKIRKDPAARVTDTLKKVFGQK